MMLYKMPFSTSPAAVSPSTACVCRFGEPIAADGIWLRPQPIGPEPRSHSRVAVPLQETFWPLGLRGLGHIHDFTSGGLLVGLRSPDWVRLVRVGSRDIRPLWGQALPIKNEEGFVFRLFDFKLCTYFHNHERRNTLRASLFLTGRTVSVRLGSETA